MINNKYINNKYLVQFSQFLILLILLSLAGCKTIEVRGQYVSDTAIEEIKRKKMTKEQVTELVGTPNYIPDYTPDTWYYLQRSISNRAWFEPKVIEQRVVQITFDRNNKVSNAILLNELVNDHFRIQSNYTKSGGTDDQNALQKFVRNIGRFSKSKDKNKRVRSKK